MPDSGERGAPDYRKTACLTLEEFERIVVRCSLFYNSERILNEYHYTEDMIQNQIRPYACDIWNWKLKELGTNLIFTSEKEIVVTLLPRTEGKFTRFGLMVNKLRYHRDGYKEEYLRGRKCTVAYNPDDVSHIWQRTNYGFEEFQIIETIYTGKTLEQVSELKQSQDTLVKNEAEKALQAKIQLMSFIETAAEQKRSPEHAAIKDIRENRKSENRKQHENIGRKLRNG